MIFNTSLKFKLEISQPLTDDIKKKEEEKLYFIKHLLTIYLNFLNL